MRECGCGCECVRGDGKHPNHIAICTVCFYCMRNGRTNKRLNGWTQAIPVYWSFACSPPSIFHYFASKLKSSTKYQQTVPIISCALFNIYFDGKMSWTMFNNVCGTFRFQIHTQIYTHTHDPIESSK